MKEFLQEYWLWILIPSLVVAAGIAALLIMANNSDNSSPFVYSIF